MKRMKYRKDLMLLSFLYRIVADNINTTACMRLYAITDRVYVLRLAYDFVNANWIYLLFLLVPLSLQLEGTTSRFWWWWWWWRRRWQRWCVWAMSRRSASQTANSNGKGRRERERNMHFSCVRSLLLHLPLSLSLACALLMLLLPPSSLTLVASRNKYHKWNREYHESA